MLVRVETRPLMNDSPSVRLLISIGRRVLGIR